MLFGVRRSAPLWTEGRAGEIKAAVTAALQGLRGENTGSGGQSAEWKHSLFGTKCRFWQIS
jgi:hypothetical protein